MGYNIVGGIRGDQVFLMPPDPREWLPEGHLAWAVRRQAAELDVTPFLAAYRADGQGRPAYHPAMMVALLVYCHAKSVLSSRAIEMATYDDVGARVICGGLHPDHSTIAGVPAPAPAALDGCERHRGAAGAEHRGAGGAGRGRGGGVDRAGPRRG